MGCCLDENGISLLLTTAMDCCAGSAAEMAGGPMTLKGQMKQSLPAATPSMT